MKARDGEEKNVVPVSTATYGCSNWKWWLNNTTLALGLQNVTDEAVCGWRLRERLRRVVSNQSKAGSGTWLKAILVLSVS